MSVSRELGTFAKDANETVIYGFDWAEDDFLSVRSTTISSSSWTVATGLTQVSASNTTTTTAVKLSGGTLGVTYRCTNAVVLANGETKERSFLVEIVDL